MTSQHRPTWHCTPTFLRVLALLAATVVGLSACSSGGDTTTGGATAAPAATTDATNAADTGATNNGVTDSSGGQVEFTSAAEASKTAAEANAGRQFGGEEFGLSQKELDPIMNQVEADYYGQ